MADSQSWTSWLWGSRPSNVPTGDAGVSPQNTEGISTRSSSSEGEHTSPYGPYVRTGRGGAGNYTWQSGTRPEDARDKIEAQEPSTLSQRRQAAAEIEHHDTDAAMRIQNSTQSPGAQYVRVGRGYVQRSATQPSPTSAAVASGQSINAKNGIVPPRAPAYTGRGGAGNFAAVAAVKEKERVVQEEESRIAEEQARALVEERVQSQLPAPPDAWLGDQRKGDHMLNEAHSRR